MMVVPETPDGPRAPDSQRHRPRRSARLSTLFNSSRNVIPDTPTSSQSRVTPRPSRQPTRILETPEISPPIRPLPPSPPRIHHPVFASPQAPPFDHAYVQLAAATQENPATPHAKVDQWLQSQNENAFSPPIPRRRSARLSGLTPDFRACSLNSSSQSCSSMQLTRANINDNLETEVSFRRDRGLSLVDFSTDSAQALIAQFEGRANERAETEGVTVEEGIFKDVVACVQVRSMHENRSKYVEQELERLGAVITANITKKTTHLIFKDGSLSTYNKAKRQGCFIVSVTWVLTSRDTGIKADEGRFPSVSCSKYDSPGLFPKLRKLKSMQPKSDEEMRQWIEARSKRRAKDRQRSILGTPEAPPLFRPVPKLDLVPRIERSQDKDDILNILDELRSPMTLVSPPKSSPHAQGTPMASPCSSEDYDTPLARRLVRKYFRTPVAQPPISPLTRVNGTEPGPQGDDGFERKSAEKNPEPASSPFYVKGKSPPTGVMSVPRRNLLEKGLFEPDLSGETRGKRCRESGHKQIRKEKKALVTPEPIKPILKNPKLRKRHQLFSQNDILSETPDIQTATVFKPIVENIHTQEALKIIPPKTKPKTKIIKDHSRIIMAQPPPTQFKEPIKKVRKDRKVKSVSVTSTTTSSSSISQKARRILPSRRSSIEFMTPKAKKSQKRSLVSEIVCTACSKTERNKTLQVVKKLGKFKLAPKVTSSTSHVIVGGESNPRTTNLLKGILQGCWIVSIQWILDCLQQGYHVDEEPYEKVDFSPAVQRCRLDRTSFGQDVYKSDLFASIGPVFIGGSLKDQVSRTELKELVHLGGGQVVKSAEDAQVIIGQTLNRSEIGSGRMHLCQSWILDSIQHHDIQPVSNYLLLST